MTAEIFIRYMTTSGLEKSMRYDTDETRINLDVRDIAEIDLLPIIWCENLESISIRSNNLTEIDLSPLEKVGRNVKAVRLSHNRIQEIDLEPLSSCPNLEEFSITENRLKRIDLSPLFQCPYLKELNIDDDVSLTANLLLRSVGSWPEVLIEKYHKILWKSDTTE
ncbi:MAG: leucine-rich repeat domain-containing protein [Candidatus Thorarchaeota archaeon]